MKNIIKKIVGLILMLVPITICSYGIAEWLGVFVVYMVLLFVVMMVSGYILFFGDP